MMVLLRPERASSTSREPEVTTPEGPQGPLPLRRQSLVSLPLGIGSRTDLAFGHHSVFGRAFGGLWGRTLLFCVFVFLLAIQKKLERVEECRETR